MSACRISPDTRPMTSERALRVLVADDDEGVTSVVARTLTREGYDVRTASDGDAAVHAMREWAADAIVLDVLMPGRDGLAVCRRLRRIGMIWPWSVIVAREAGVIRAPGGRWMVACARRGSSR